MIEWDVYFDLSISDVHGSVYFSWHIGPATPKHVSVISSWCLNNFAED